MALKHFLLLLLSIALFSCGNEQKEKLIIGKWQYHKTGYKYGEETRWEFQEVSQNYSVQFNKDGGIIVDNGGTETHKGVYKLINNGKSIVSELYMPYEKDTTNILKLGTDTLQIQTKDICMQLKRIK